MGDNEYQSFMQMSIEDLTFHASGFGTGSTLEKAKLVLNQRMIEQQHEYAKQQIELQHTKNMQLLTKQLRWVKFSAILNAIAIIAAVLLGWFLGEWKSSRNQPQNTKQILQPQKESSPLPRSVTDLEIKTDKTSLAPPKQYEKRK